MLKQGNPRLFSQSKLNMNFFGVHYEVGMSGYRVTEMYGLFS